MNYGPKIIKDFCAEMYGIKDCTVLNIGEITDGVGMNLCVVYYTNDAGKYDQFFTINTDDNCFIADEKLEEYRYVFLHNRIYRFNKGLQDICTRYHFKELCRLPQCIIQEELKRMEAIHEL